MANFTYPSWPRDKVSATLKGSRDEVIPLILARRRRFLAVAGHGGLHRTSVASTRHDASSRRRGTDSSCRRVLVAMVRPRLLRRRTWHAGSLVAAAAARDRRLVSTVTQSDVHRGPGDSLRLGDHVRVEDALRSHCGRRLSAPRNSWRRALARANTWLGLGQVSRESTALARSRRATWKAPELIAQALTMSSPNVSARSSPGPSPAASSPWSSSESRRCPLTRWRIDSRRCRRR